MGGDEEGRKGDSDFFACLWCVCMFSRKEGVAFLGVCVCVVSSHSLSTVGTHPFTHSIPFSCHCSSNRDAKALQDKIAMKEKLKAEGGGGGGSAGGGGGGGGGDKKKEKNAYTVFIK